METLNIEDHFGVVCAHHLVGISRIHVNPSDFLNEPWLENLTRLQIGYLSKKGLERIDTDEGPAVVLATTPEFKLPRQKPMPMSIPKTPWEKFAEAKGIQRRKRSRHVWDDTLKEYKPRWGPDKRRKEAHTEAIFELKPNESQLLNLKGQPPICSGLKEGISQHQKKKKLLRKQHQLNTAKNQLGLVVDSTHRAKSIKQIKTLKDRSRRSTASVGRHPPPQKISKKKKR